MKPKTPTLLSSSLVLAATAALYGQEPAKPAPQVRAPVEEEEGTLGQLFDRELPDAISKSRISLNSRLRWEMADQDGLEESNAITVRTRFGFTSGDFYGFQGMLEGENVTVIGPEHNYNAAGSNSSGAGRTSIADPPTTEMNQGWLSYSRWNTVVKGGRQHLTLDNHRFIGDVNWRQNQQTFDAVAVRNQSVENLSLLYGYLWEVNRVFGDVEGLPAANEDFGSDSHLVNVQYRTCEHAVLTGYTYLLDLENDAAASLLNSTATYGGNLTGHVLAHERVDVTYRGEFAWQNDYSDNPADYGTAYYAVEAGVNVKPVTLGAGYEVLGSDNGQGFKTPLATLHAFNGWADVFLNTPADGLRDLYGFVQFDLPGKVPLRGIYHKFEADSGSNDYGWELDVVASHKFGKHWTALVKYAHYDGMDVYVDVDKFWAQLEFNY